MTCKRGHQCRYLHVDESNYDHTERGYVEDQDHRFVTEDLVRRMEHVHEEGRQHALNRQKKSQRLEANDEDLHIDEQVLSEQVLQE